MYIAPFISKNNYHLYLHLFVLIFLRWSTQRDHIRVAQNLTFRANHDLPTIPIAIPRGAVDIPQGQMYLL